jgi:predicted DNA-binding transcriptional regulator AlpA
MKTTPTTAPRKALSLRETCETLGISERTFYDRAARGDRTVTFLLETCMKGARRRWRPADVEQAIRMEQQS